MALAMMRMGDRDGERVGGVVALRIGLRQQHADHHADLRPCRHGPRRRSVFFTRFGAYSATRDSGARRHQHGDAARLAELERRAAPLC